MTAKRVPLAARLLRLAVLWFLLGAAYFLIEILWRAPRGQFPHWSMWVVGGLCGVAVGAVNQVPRFFGLHMRTQAVLGAAMVLAIEFAAGCYLNLHLGLGIWDYGHLPGNLLGQVCPLFGLAWLALMPFAIWLEDRLRWGFGWEGRKYSLLSAYKEFCEPIWSIIAGLPLYVKRFFLRG